MKKAFTGRHKSAFRDNYLAAMITVAALFFTSMVSAQTAPKRAQLQQINAKGYTYNSGEYRIVFYLPLDSIHGADSGAIAYKNGRLYISKDTLHWEPYGKALQLTDSSFIVGVDTIVIHGTGGGGGGITTIPNAGGSGDTLWNGSAIKRLDHDATIFHSVNGNKILHGVDTFINVASRPQLRDTAANLHTAIATKKNLQRHYGTIYNKNSWTTLDLTNNGATASVVSNKINVSGGAGDWDQTLDIPGGTLLEKWKITGKFRATEKSSTSYGFGVGVRSYNSYARLDCAGRFDATSSGNGILSLRNSNVDKIVTSALGFSVNDYIILTVERNVDIFTITAKNVNTGATVSGTYICDPTNSPALHNSGRFCVFSYGGTFTLDSLNVTSKETRNAPLLIIGDSKTQLAGTGVNFFNRYGFVLNTYYSPVVISAGSSDRTGEVVLRTDEIIALKPMQVLLAIGSNDPRSGVSSATTNANYDTIYNRLTAAGIKVYHLLPFPENTGGSGVDQSALRSHIIATYPAADIIDTETPLAACSSCLSADDVHPNEAAQTVIANAIVESFKLNDVVQGLGDAALKSQENTFTNRNLFLADYTTKAAIRANSFVIQPYGTNNVFQGDNFEYNGSAFVRKYAGYSSIWYQQNGTHIFQTAGTSSAGSSITFATRFKIFNNGNISNTDSDPGVTFGITGDAAIKPNSGSTAGLLIHNTGTGPGGIGFGGLVNSGAANPIIYSNNQYLAINSAAGYPLYLNFDNSNSASYVDFFAGNARVGRDGTVFIGRTSKVGTEVFSNNGRSFFGDTGTLAARFSYTHNIHGTFTGYSLVDKSYVDSALSASGNGIYSGSGTLPSNVSVSGAGNSLALGTNGSQLSTLFIYGTKISVGARMDYLTDDVNTDANYTVVSGRSVIEVRSNLTADRTFTLPAASLGQGDRLTVIMRYSTNVNHYQLASAIEDNKTGTTFTQLEWGTTYMFHVSSGGNWILIDKY